MTRTRALRLLAVLTATVALTACGRLENVGKEPGFSPLSDSHEHAAMAYLGLPDTIEHRDPSDQASLWSGGRKSLLGDRRASGQGDILTVVVEIDDRAEISNSTDRSRSSNQNLAIPNFFGIPQRIDENLPAGASMAEAVGTSATSGHSGDGSVSRNEKLTLRVAATVTQQLPNGVLRIQGRQEVRVNFELRELIVQGFVRPEDISRQNEITYDKIASAQISYGGRGQITDVQQPRWGQQVADIILPF